MEKEGSEKRRGDPMESESRFQTTNWGDNPSPWGFNLMKLALDKFNRDWAQLVKDKPDTYALVQFAFVGGLHISSFINEGVWCHLIFKTKKVDVVDPALDDHGPYLFFAELKRPLMSSKYVVKSVCHFGAAKYAKNIKLNGCKACDRARHRDIIKHPMRGFNVGYTPQYEETGGLVMGEDQVDLETEVETAICNDDTTADLRREVETILALQSPICNNDTTVLYGDLPDELAKLSLHYYNEAARNNREPQYQLNKSKCCALFKCPTFRWYHLNFIAHAGSMVEEMLFFAEVKSHLPTNRVDVMLCDILGPVTHVAPRLAGCIGCDMTSVRSEISHPINGGKNRAEFLITGDQIFK